MLHFARWNAATDEREKGKVQGVPVADADDWVSPS
jgi:hypothetical protein